MSQKNAKKVALVMSSVLLMSQMGFADVVKEEKAAQEQVVLKKDKKAADAEAALQSEAIADNSDNMADEENEG
jgi:hypothetical protein